jgi:two-component system response regulator NreC
MTIRVLLADDHAIVREGVRRIVESEDDLEVVGEASDGREAVALTEELEPNIVLMDLTMPELGGLEATAILHDRFPDVRVLVLTMHESHDYFFQVLKAGASGYVLKGASGAELIAALRAVNRGDVYIQPPVAKRLVADYLRHMDSAEDKAHYDGLTERERQILRLIAEGSTSQQIADSLVLSVNTVNTHRRHIMEKLNLHNRADLIRYAVRKGLVTE